MAGIAEFLPVMTMSAVFLLAVRIKTMRVFIVKVVNPAIEIVAPMTFDTETLIAVTSPAIIRVARRFFAVLMPPVLRMNIEKRDFLPVADCTVIAGAGAVMAFHAQRHSRHVRIARFFAVGDSVMAMRAFNLLLEMLFVAERYRSFGIGQCLRIIGIMVACPAVIDIFDIMTIAAGFHGWI